MQVEAIIFSIVILVISVVIHEVAHGVMAYWLGDPTAKLAGRLTLNPIPHIDPIGSVILPLFMALASSGGFIVGWAKPVPYNPYNLKAGKWGPAYVAAAGPASNILLATIFGLILRFNLVASEAMAGFFVQIIFVNIMLAVFNLIPIPPLDGSKVLFSALPYRLHYIEQFLTQYQLIFLIAFVMWGGGIILPVAVAVFKLIVGG